MSEPAKSSSREDLLRALSREPTVEELKALCRRLREELESERKENKRLRERDVVFNALLGRERNINLEEI